MIGQQQQQQQHQQQQQQQRQQHQQRFNSVRDRFTINLPHGSPTSFSSRTLPSLSPIRYSSKKINNNCFYGSSNNNSNIGGNLDKGKRGLRKIQSTSALLTLAIQQQQQQQQQQQLQQQQKQKQ